MKESESVIAQRKAVRNDLQVCIGIVLYFTVINDIHFGMQTIEEACKQLEKLQEKCIF